MHAGGGAGDTGDGEEAGGGEREHFGEQIGAAEGEAGADARYAVGLREGTEDDDVFIGGHEIVAGLGGGGEVDVGFVDDDDGVLLFIGEEVLDVLARGDGAGGVVGVADVVDAGVGVSLDHGFDVVRIVGPKGDADDFGADVSGGAAAVAGVGHDPATSGRGEGAGGAMERIGGAGGGHDVVGFDAFELGDDFSEGLGFVGGGVAAAERGDLIHGLEAFLAGAERVFMAGDANGVVGHWPATAHGLTLGFLGHGVFVIEGHGGGAREELRDAAARNGRERRGVEVQNFPCVRWGVSRSPVPWRGGEGAGTASAQTGKGKRNLHLGLNFAVG